MTLASDAAVPLQPPLFSQPPALRMEGVTKRYDHKAVLDDVFLSVPAGSVMGLLGKNGAGKTTLIKCALGLIRPNSGVVALLGEPALDLSATAKARLGYVPQEISLYPWMRVRQLLDYTAAFYPRWNSALVDQLLADWELNFNDKIGSKARAALVMLTLVPGVVVASGWRERWPALGYESLFPSGREQFVKEIAVGLALDLAEFWFAALVICVAVLAFFTPRLLLTPPFIISVLASAMMQVLWFGTIFLTSRFRQVVPYVASLIGVGLGILMPMFQFWENNRLLRIGSFLLIALAEMICGVVFLILGLGLWRRADLA